MKSINALVLAIIFAFISIIKVDAQSAETIWLLANTTAYKTGETVTITLNAITSTPIQGFTFQIRYDPACLKPVNATSPISGMNGLQLPQTVGLVDASFASTSPQAANGVLAEVRFVTLGGCQTNLTLESAALAIRNESGFAAPLAGVVVGEKNISLNIDKEVGVSQDVQVSGTPLLLSPDGAQPASTMPAGTMAVLAVLGILVVAGIFILIKQLSGPGSQKNIQK